MRIVALLPLLGAIACGGQTSSASPPESDGGVHQVDGGSRDAGTRQRDSFVPDDARLTHDGQTVDAHSTHDASVDVAPVVTKCEPPTTPEGGQYLGCAQAVCPSGTVCVQRDFDVTSTATCVTIPASCGGQPTCACMGPEAQQCVEPGPPFTDATPTYLRCQDDEDADASFLDFPCGCA
jgi:hypothetical protein